jgi:beta-galactosidase
MIQLTVEGAGSLIGFDNGNPRDSVSMKSNARKLFNGLALAIIQPDGKAGSIRVKAVSPGIKEASLEIMTQRLTVPPAAIESLKK